MADRYIPCPRCAEKLVLDARSAGQRVVCPACDALFTMPALSAPPPASAAATAQPPAAAPASGGAALPPARAKGDQPRAFAIDPPPELLPTPASFPRSPATPSGQRSVLPLTRKSERPMPELTPAPYQPELSASSRAAAPAPRADLPAPRPANESPRMRAPLPTEDTPPPAPAPARTEPPRPPAESAPRAANHPIAGSRRLPFRPQGTIDFDPETKDNWGQRVDDPAAATARGSRIALWALLIAVPLVAGVLWQTFHRGRPSTPEAEPRTLTPGAVAAEEVRAASETTRQFLATTTVDDRARLVRHPEVTKPRMQAWHTPANPLRPLKVLRFNDRSTEQTIDGVTFILLIMELDDFTTRAIGLERTGSGFLVDWESFVFWSEIPWGEFLTKQPAEPGDFRVSVEISDYYSGAFDDQTKFLCYRLTDPENWGNCYGYCGIDSEVGMEINRMIRRQRQAGGNVVKAILRLRFLPESRGHNQVVIEDVIQDGWLSPAP
jgi:hypothetical protein